MTSCQNIRSILFGTAAVGVALCAFDSPAVAQSGGGSLATADAEIIVTARKRDERLLDVPVTITAIGGAELARAGASDLAKIGQMIPQTRFEKVGGGGSGATFAIRGVGSPSADKGIEQTVAVNIDGVQSSRGKLSVLSFFDVQQVEVLKGPQALFFGKNSPGGVIAVKSANPGKELEGYVRAGYEFVADERFAEAAIGGPVTDTLGVRVAVRAAEMEGWVRNQAQAGPNPFNPDAPLNPGRKRLPGSKELLGRITVAWAPTSDFDMNLKLFGATVRENNEFGAGEVICDSRYTQPTTQGVVDPNGDCKLDGRASHGGLPEALAGAGWPGSRNGDPYQDTDALFATLTTNYRLENFAITLVSGAMWFDSQGYDNYDGTVYARLTGETHEKSKSFSQEVRVASTFDGPFNVTMGGYYETTKRESGGIGGAGLNTPDARNGQNQLWTREEVAHGTTYSLFGQAEWKLLPELTLSGGARFTKESKRLRASNVFVNQSQLLAPGRPASSILLPEGVVVRPRRTDSNVSPEVTLTYKPRQNLMAYVAYRTGYKSGGLSSSSILGPTVTAENMQFEPEKAKGGEIGMKGEFFDRRWTLTATLYRYTFSNLQSTSFDPGPPPIFRLRNAGGARTTGFEATSQFRVNEMLSLSGAIAYNKGRYTSFAGAPCFTGQTLAQGCVSGQQDLTGHQLPYNPTWSGNAGFQFDMPVSDAMKIGFDASAVYGGDYWANTNENPLARQQGFWKLNATVRLHETNDKWELALVGRNLTNERYIVYESDKPGGPSTGGQALVATGRPREVMVQASWRF